MSAIEITLLIVGLVLFIGSFFITEKLSNSDLKKMAELSEDQINVIMEDHLTDASKSISEMVDSSVDLSLNKINRSLEKETNEKIMAISEYSDVVLGEIEKTNNEVTFLYSMLGDKHEEIMKSITTLNEEMEEYKELQKRPLPKEPVYVEVPVQVPVQAPVQNSTNLVKESEASETVLESELTEEITSVNEENVKAEVKAETIDPELRKEEVIKRYKNGDKLANIAKELNMGVGEVQLIVGLYI